MHPARRPAPNPAWSGPLLAPVAGIARSLPRWVAGYDADLARSGLGLALVYGAHVGVGGSRWDAAGRAAAAAVEGWNQAVHRDPSLDRAAAARADLGPTRRLWDALRRRADARLREAVDRLIVLEAADLPIPEPVLFWRAALAAGALTGGCEPAAATALDAAATWTGLALAGPVSEAERAGALASARLDDPGGDALLVARRAVAALPGSAFTEAWLDALAAAEGVDLRPPRFPAWRPALLSVEPPRPARPLAVSADAFEVEARRWEPAITAAMSDVLPPTGALGRAASQVAHRGGKRLRPLLCLAACAAAGAPPERALPAAACVEWLHEASLLLDDIVDEAPLRRGQPALHRVAGPAFAAAVAGAALLGVERVSRGLPEASRATLAAAATALVDGQHEELARAGEPDLEDTACYRIIEAKTARLFATAAKLGAQAASAPAATERALARFAAEVGLAFQLVDDLLDLVGEEARLGKAPGADLAAGRPTWPFALLRAGLGPSERARLDAWLRDGHRPTGEELAWLRASVARLGVDAAVHQRAAAHRARAEAALEALPPGHDRERLRWLAARLVERQS
jgi:octaprenyl-diphosphate synthase